MTEKKRNILPLHFFDRYGLKGLYLNYDTTNHLHPEYLKQVLRPFGIFLSRSFSHARILDVASGTGDVAKYLSGLKNLQVVQADISHYALGRSKGQRVRALAQELPFEDSSFEVIHMKDALLHFEDQRELLMEFNRILKPSGYLLLTSFEYSKKNFGLILKSFPIISTLLPYIDKNQFISWTTFLEKLKIFDITSPFFPVSEKVITQLANEMGLKGIRKVNWTTDWKNPDWTLFPEKRFSILFQKNS